MQKLYFVYFFCLIAIDFFLVLHLYEGKSFKWKQSYCLLHRLYKSFGDFVLNYLFYEKWITLFGLKNKRWVREKNVAKCLTQCITKF